MGDLPQHVYRKAGTPYHFTSFADRHDIYGLMLSCVFFDFILHMYMDRVGRSLLDKGIRDYLLQQIKKEFGDDFQYVGHRIDYLIANYNLKDLRWAIKREIEDAKKSE